MQTLPVKLVRRGDEISIYASYPVIVAKVVENKMTDTVFVQTVDGNRYEFYSTATVTIITHRENK